MPNAEAIKFMKQLVAAFGRFKISDETKAIYTSKLSGWRLTLAQWDKTLDILLDKQDSDNLPSLGDIYSAIRQAQNQTVTNRDYGWVRFELNNYDYVMRIVNNNGTWVIAYPKKHEKEDVSSAIPKGAVNIKIYPDNPIREQNDEL